MLSALTFAVLAQMSCVGGVFRGASTLANIFLNDSSVSRCEGSKSTVQWCWLFSACKQTFLDTHRIINKVQVLVLCFVYTVLDLSLFNWVQLEVKQEEAKLYYVVKLSFILLGLALIGLLSITIVNFVG